MKERTISGPFEVDQNFVTVYHAGRVFTLARNENEDGTRNWGSIGIGERTATGHIFGYDAFAAGRKRCEEKGTFALYDSGWRRVI